MIRAFEGKTAVLNIRQLQYLVMTVRCGGYSAAARRLFVTPRAVSKAINDLEEEYGISLFVKDGARVVPTDLASRLAEKAEGVVLDFEQIQSSLEAYSGVKPHVPMSLKIGVAGSYPRGTCCDLLAVRKVFDSDSDLSCDFVVAQNGVCYSALAAEKLDAAIVVGRQSWEGYVSSKLFSYSPIVLVGDGSKLSPKQTLSIDDLMSVKIAAPLDFIEFRSLLEARLSKSGYKQKLVDLNPEIATHQEFLDHGGVIFVFPSQQVLSRFKNVTAKDLSPDCGVKNSVFLMYPKNSPKGKYLCSLRSSFMRCFSLEGDLLEKTVHA